MQKYFAMSKSTFGKLKCESSSTMKIACLGVNQNIFILFLEFIFGMSLNKMKVNVASK